MSKKSTRQRSRAAAESGRLGGLARTPAKQHSSRENGKKGGRPRKIEKHEKPLPSNLLANMVLDLEACDRAFANASVRLAKYVLTAWVAA